MNTKQYNVLVKVNLVISVDEDETDLHAVIADMDYDFNVHPETDHADIVNTNIFDYEVDYESVKTDTIKL